MRTNRSSVRRNHYFYSLLFALLLPKSGHSQYPYLEVLSPALHSNIIQGTPVTIHYVIPPPEVNVVQGLYAIPCDGVEPYEASWSCSGSIEINGWAPPNNYDEVTYVWDTSSVPEGAYWIWLEWDCPECPSYGMLRWPTKINVLSKPPTPNLTSAYRSVNSGQTYLLEWNYRVCAEAYELEECTSFYMSGTPTFVISNPTTLSKEIHHAETDTTTYKYWIRAVNYTRHVQSDWSNILAVKVAGAKLHAIPGKIENEDYYDMNGIQLEATGDSGAGKDVTSFDAGDWLDYTVDVQKAGDYDAALRIALAAGNPVKKGKILNDTQTLASFSVSQTGGWQKWETIHTNLHLNAGRQTLRLLSEEGPFNINWMELTQTAVVADTVEVLSPVLHVNIIKDTPVTIHYKIGPTHANDYTDLWAIPCDNLSPIDHTSCSGSILIKEWIRPNDLDEATYIWDTSNIPEEAYWIWLMFYITKPDGTPYDIMTAKWPTKINVLGKLPTPIFTSTDKSVNSGQAYTLEWSIPVCTDAYELQESTSYFMDGARTFVISDPNTQSREIHHTETDTTTFFYRIRGVNNTRGVQSDWSSILAVKVVGAEPLAIPGKIESEEYFDMYGIQLEATSDSGGGQNVTSFDAGDWLDYYVDIQNAGDYDAALRIALAAESSLKKGKILRDTQALASFSVSPTGGWQTYHTVHTALHLDAGKQMLRILSEEGPFNINWIEFTLTTGVAENMNDRKVRDFGMDPSYPNPFNSRTRVRYQVPERSDVRLAVYDLRGHMVRSLVEGTVSPGVHDADWDGMNNDAEPVPSGVYIYRIEAREGGSNDIRYIEVRKMILMK